MGLVGAFNVGSIRLENESDRIVTNQPNELLYKNYKHRKQYERAWAVPQGAQLGRFEVVAVVTCEI